MWGCKGLAQAGGKSAAAAAGRCSPREGERGQLQQPGGACSFISQNVGGLLQATGSEPGSGDGAGDKIDSRLTVPGQHRGVNLRMNL